MGGWGWLVAAALAAPPGWVTFDLVQPDRRLVSVADLLKERPVLVVIRNPAFPCCPNLGDQVRTVQLWVPRRSTEPRPKRPTHGWLAQDRHGLAAHQLGLSRSSEAVVLNRQGVVSTIRLDRAGSAAKLLRASGRARR